MVEKFQVFVPPGDLSPSTSIFLPNTSFNLSPLRDTVTCELDGQRYPLRKRVTFIRSLDKREAVMCRVSPVEAKKSSSLITEFGASGMSKRTTNSLVSATSPSPLYGETASTPANGSCGTSGLLNRYFIASSRS